jgi:hypothetical protein
MRPNAATGRRISLSELMVLIAGLAVGIWIAMPKDEGQKVLGEPGGILLVALPLGGLSIVGLPLLLTERFRRDRRLITFGAGRLLWFAQGMASCLLWPPIIYLLVRRGSTNSTTLICYFYVTPLASLFLLPALVAGGWFRGRRRRRIRSSWRERFGIYLTLAWAALGLYVLGNLYLEDFKR